MHELAITLYNSTLKSSSGDGEKERGGNWQGDGSSGHVGRRGETRHSKKAFMMWSDGYILHVPCPMVSSSMVCLIKMLTSLSHRVITIILAPVPIVPENL